MNDNSPRERIGLDVDVAETTCDESVGPKTWEEATRRGIDGEPFNFRPVDFERANAADGEDAGEEVTRPSVGCSHAFIRYRFPG